MLGGEAVFGEQDAHAARPSQPGGELAMAAERSELVATAVQVEQRAAGVGARGGKPTRWHVAGVQLGNLDIDRHGAEVAHAVEHRARLRQGRRLLPGRGLPARTDGGYDVLHCLARHVVLNRPRGLSRPSCAQRALAAPQIRWVVTGPGFDESLASEHSLWCFGPGHGDRHG